MHDGRPSIWHNLVIQTLIKKASVDEWQLSFLPPFLRTIFTTATSRSLIYTPPFKVGLCNFAVKVCKWCVYGWHFNICNKYEMCPGNAKHAPLITQFPLPFLWFQDVEIFTTFLDKLSSKLTETLPGPTHQSRSSEWAMAKDNWVHCEIVGRKYSWTRWCVFSSLFEWGIPWGRRRIIPRSPDPGPSLFQLAGCSIRNFSWISCHIQRQGAERPRQEIRSTEDSSRKGFGRVDSPDRL